MRYPGAYAAALVDVEGETVDYAGDADPFTIRVTAAHLRIVLATLQRMTLGAPRTVIVRGGQRSFLVSAQPEDYALVLLLKRRAGFMASRALVACERAIAHEAGWGIANASSAWFPVLVSCDRRHHPTRVRPAALCRTRGEGKIGRDDRPLGAEQRVEIIGTVVGMKAREVGYRARLESGVELTLVREPGDFWYADEPIDVAPQSSRAPSHATSPGRLPARQLFDVVVKKTC